MKYDPAKKGKEMDLVLSRYEFTDIVASLQKKFGALPDGWGKKKDKGVLGSLFSF
jgi:hypothetical protein